MSDLPYGGLPDNVSYNYGLDFNYSIWNAYTEISLHNVPWNNDYRDVVYFDEQETLDEYLDANSGPTVRFASYAKVNEPVRIDIPFNKAYMFNYLRVWNPRQPIEGDVPRTFYYFIQDVTYIAPNTTEFVLQLDIWQTFIHYAEFGKCYVERGHIGIANENQFADNGREHLTVPEGFDIGNEYYIDNVYEHEIADNGIDVHGGGDGYFILVWSTVDLLNINYGDLAAPNITTANGCAFERLPNGAECIVFDSPFEYINAMRIMAQFPWITQGIITVMAVPRFELNEPYITHDVVLHTGKGHLTKYPIGSFTCRKLRDNQTEIKNKVITLEQAWRNDIKLGNRYRFLQKFKTYPYSAVELTTYSATPIILKPEGLEGDDLKVVQMTHLMLPNPRVMFYPLRYNTKPGYVFDEEAVVNGHHDFGEYMDVATGFTNFPTFAVVNDAATLAVANQTNTIAYQRREADWSQQKALTANQLGYNQSTEQIRNMNDIASLNLGANNASLGLANQTSFNRGVVDAVGGVGRGLLGGGLGIVGGLISAGSTVANTAIDINQQTQQTGINNALLSNTTRTNARTAAYNRDTNKDYADFASRGDYAMQIGAINAKVQDAQLVPPTTVGQVGGEAFSLVTSHWAVVAKVKRISPNAINTIGEYWLRYGYAINKFASIPHQFACMTHFTYWKLKETYIKSSQMPESFKQSIRGILEKGVTVWTDPDYIGNIDIGENTPLKGIEL